jgi:hypothetical protein
MLNHGVMEIWRVSNAERFTGRDHLCAMRCGDWQASKFQQ